MIHNKVDDDQATGSEEEKAYVVAAPATISTSNSNQLTIAAGEDQNLGGGDDTE